MNLNQIINRVARIFIRKGVNWGINKGGDALARGGKPAVTHKPAQAAPDRQAALARQARDTAKRARKAAQLTRRIGR